MTAKGYTERVRMNDYVGSPRMADLTWPARCTMHSSGKHRIGLLSGHCLKCKVQAEISYISTAGGNR